MTHSYLIAPSHGAEIFGVPVTPGKRSPNGRFIEGVFTRRVVSGFNGSRAPWTVSTRK
jgi:hypothetical protein